MLIFLLFYVNFCENLVTEVYNHYSWFKFYEVLKVIYFIDRKDLFKI
jgi:hypothetical protein